ncbi:hypothetical protein BC938DRAFT_472487 [Jimgerdemannia flammicorona]|uniref:oligopeptidase A n=1 Tax=Jimgerdemannia flammicorona TaxID=994334 RepID=A0A433QTW3_9FUNG|nr:hypothetical protein BC938DRAFT_472487 [Jimgerdemannia flammicorona]
MHRPFLRTGAVRATIFPKLQNASRAISSRILLAQLSRVSFTTLAGHALVPTLVPTRLPTLMRHLTTVVDAPPPYSAPPTANVFVDWSLFPDFASILPVCNPDKAVPIFDAFVKRIEREFVEREARFEPTWKGCIGAVQDLEDQLERAYGVISHLNSVKNSPELRQVVESIQPLVVKLSLLMNQSLSKYHALTTLRSTPTAWSSLDPVQQRIVDLTIRDMRLAGVGLLPGSAEKVRFNAIHERLSLLGTRFGNNQLDATKRFGQIVTDRKELEGCSSELLVVLTANLQRKEVVNRANPENGPWCITLDAPTYVPFMMNCKNRELREKIYRANITRASKDELNNEPIINEMLNLRQEEATLLGFDNYASLSLSTKMAQDLPSAEGLLTSLITSSLPAARAELAALTDFASATLAHPTPLQPWDIAYVSEAYRKHLFRYDEEAISHYFAFPRVIDGLFRLADEVFGVQVAEVGEDERARLGIRTWHPDVKVFRVQEGGITRAYFYGDFYSRPEEKRSGAWMDLVTTRMRGEGDEVRVPVAYLICNQLPPSSSDKSPLMKFADIRTLFHEFGHCLQHMLTTVDYPQASGIKGIEWDFVEVASQFMENFIHEPAWLARLSAHHETGEPMPAEMVDALERHREFMSGMTMTRQVSEQ